MLGGRQKLDREERARMRRRVLDRDDWRCQRCGGRSRLEVHHIQFRSHQGPDREENLLTLCSDCHRRKHSAGSAHVGGDT